MKDVLQTLNKHLNRFGLNVKLTEKKSLKWKYDRRFDDSKNPVAFIHFDTTLTQRLQCHSVFIDPIEHVSIPLDYKFDNAMIAVYMKSIPSMSYYSSNSWSPVREISLPSKYYSTVTDFLQVLNSPQEKDYTFSYDKESRRFTLDVVNDCVVKISDRLKTILGFDKNVFFKQKFKAPREPLLDRNIHHFYLYTNIVMPTHVGGAQVPLLRYIPITNAEYGQTLFIEWNNLTYLPVSVSELSQVELALYDDTGEPVNFTEGRTVVTLHFRKT